MDEEKTPEKKEQTAPADNPAEGNVTEANSLIDKANSAAERIETALKRNEEILRQQQAETTKLLLSGRTHAGQETQKKEETPAEYRDRVMRGELNERPQN